MIDQIAVWAGILLGGSAAVAWIGYFMRQGETQGRSKSASDSAALAHAKLEMHIKEYNNDRVQDAREYVTLNQLNASEKRLTDTVESVRADIRAMCERMDRYFEGQQRARP